MAIKFNKLKDPKLGMLDKLTFGKLKGCRVCDIIQDHYEYLIWCEKQGFAKYTQEVTNVILDAAHFERWSPPPKVFKDSFDQINGYIDNFEDENDTVYYADGSGYVKARGPCGPLYFDRNGNT